MKCIKNHLLIHGQAKMEGMPLRGIDVNVGIAQVDDRPLILQRHRVQTVRLQVREIFDAVQAELQSQAQAALTRDILSNHCIDKAFHSRIKSIRR